MTKRLLCATAVSLAILGLSFSFASAQPWKEPQDTFAALFEPDRYAWRLFVALSWPANVANKEADASKTLGAPGTVVWETWRNVRPEAPDTVFRLDGSDPGPWLGPPGPVIARAESQFDRSVASQTDVTALRRRRGAPAPQPMFDEGGGGAEVRMNSATYEFIRQNKLYNVQGQLAQFVAGQENLFFPPNAKEIKAAWRRIDVSDRPRYHWAEVTMSNGSKETWGLISLHIITKDLPNWFWSTFEHIDNKTSGPTWSVKSVDRVACPTPPHDCDQAPTGFGLEGTKWANYRLRGSQIDFINSIGAPTTLSNSQLEAVQNSSCMTCHAMATIDAQGASLGFQFIKGSPQPSWFQDSAGRRIYMQQDFVFSLTRASRANP